MHTFLFDNRGLAGFISGLAIAASVVFVAGVLVGVRLELRTGLPLKTEKVEVDGQFVPLSAIPVPAMVPAREPQSSKPSGRKVKKAPRYSDAIAAIDPGVQRNYDSDRAQPAPVPMPGRLTTPALISSLQAQIADAARSRDSHGSPSNTVARTVERPVRLMPSTSLGSEGLEKSQAHRAVSILGYTERPHTGGTSENHRIGLQNRNRGSSVPIRDDERNRSTRVGSADTFVVVRSAPDEVKPRIDPSTLLRGPISPLR
jgi:hypothetical protein